MQEIINKIGPYYLGAGGFGDFLVSLTTFYDKVDSANLIWFADNKELIQTGSKLFSKLKTRLIFSKNSPEFYDKWFQILDNPNCLGTGVTPRELVYKEWERVNIFDKYGVIEFPEFVNEIVTIRANPSKQAGVMLSGNSSNGKNKIITEKTMEIIAAELEDYDVFIFGNKKDIPSYTPPTWIQGTSEMNLHKQMQWIKGMDVFYSVDSWCKTWSAFNKIPTIVYDSVYDPGYLNAMNGYDWGHYVFLQPWSKIELREQS